jgi:magnesium transporter
MTAIWHAGALVATRTAADIGRPQTPIDRAPPVGLSCPAPIFRRPMLTLHICSPTHQEIIPQLDGATLPPGTTWIDLLNGTAAEVDFVQRVTGLHLPSFERLSEIESSSRLNARHGALFLSTPLIYRPDDGDPVTTPVGFVLTPQFVITIRFQPLAAFKSFTQQVAKRGPPHPSSTGVFVGLIEAVVDRLADVLEHVGGDLDELSQRVFRGEAKQVESVRRPARESANLRDVLRRVGRDGDLASKIRDSLLGIARIVPYTAGHAADWMPPEMKPSFETLRLDLMSLSDYDGFLTTKVQLLLDATLGLINVEQNNIIKVLTIVSVVGVPPTLVASMYGMNFKHMPELDWAWGYPYGLTLIVLSAVLPLLWFKVRGWL